MSRFILSALPLLALSACTVADDRAATTEVAAPLVSPLAMLQPAEAQTKNVATTLSSRSEDPLFARAAGRWIGSCDIWIPGRDEPVQTVGIERITEPTEDPATYTWTLIYKTPAGDQVRPYIMSADPARPGRYVLDEGGLYLSHYLIGDVLYSDFDVPGARLLARDEIRHNRYDFEIQVSATTPELTNDLGEGFLVNAYRMNSIQRCSMRRAGRGHRD